MAVNDVQARAKKAKFLVIDEHFAQTQFDPPEGAALAPTLRPVGKKPSASRDKPAANTGLRSLKIDRSAPPSRRGTNWLPLAPAAVLLVAGLVWWGLLSRAIEVKTTAVVVSTPSQQYVQLTASGYVVAQTRAAVASKAAGRLIELNVREGSQVKKGQLIARLDASDVRATMLVASAGVQQAQATVRQAEVEQANAGAELTRTRGLEAQGFVSPQAVGNAQARANSAQATVAAARAGLAQTRAQLQVQHVNQEFTEIRAPFDGVVLMKNANVGDMITPMSSAAGAQGAVVTMADLSTLEVEADVSEGNLSKARPGQPVEITLDALPGKRFRGLVAGIVPTVDRAKATVMTKIRFEQLDPLILPEMSARVSFLSKPITAADQQTLLAVNPAALVMRGDEAVVFKLRQGERADRWEVEAVGVAAGRTLGDVLEITAVRGTLKAGDKLALHPSRRLKTGSAVSLPSS